MPALDGLRAFAVAAVLVYHLGLPWLPGGLLGVDAFFVLSGFLITTLMLREIALTGTVALRRFWGRRARRLLPALLLVLLFVAGYAQWLASTDDRQRLRLDALSTLGYVANWRFATSHQSYFDRFAAPSPLLHTWSLAVEEQFYALWPLVVVSALLIVKWRRRHVGRELAASRHRVLAHTVAVLAGCSAAASIGWTALLALRGTDVSRLYYGSDTRAQALLVGAFLAAVLSRHPSVGQYRLRLAYELLGWVGASVLLLFWLRVQGQSAVLYRGGFALVAFATAGVIASVVVTPHGGLARLLSLAPLRALGRISYGVYLWHWPAFLVLTHSRSGLSGPSLIVARLTATLVLSVLSYALVEKPVRAARFRGWRPRLITPLALATTTAVVVVATAHQPLGRGQSGERQLYQLQAQAAQTGPLSPTRTPVGVPRPVKMMVVGDSVALTLAVGLGDEQKRFNVRVIPHGWVGCGLARKAVGFDGIHTYPAYVDCAHWDDRYREWLAADKPDVTIVMIGRWEVIDRLWSRGWVHVGESDFDAYLSREMDHAIDTLSSRGGKVALMTVPTFETRERPDGGTYPQDDPVRVQRLNTLLRQAASRHPQNTAIVDLAALFSPDGQFHRSIQGVQVRWNDGIHITIPGGHMVAEHFFPEILQLALPRVQHPSRTGT